MVPKLRAGWDGGIQARDLEGWIARGRAIPLRVEGHNQELGGLEGGGRSFLGP